MIKQSALFDQAHSWHQEGKGVALATVIKTWGSSPRPIGSHLLVSDDRHFTGSVSGGCVESAVIESATEVIREGKPQQLRFSVADQRAWDVGLSCGGSIVLWVEPLSLEAINARKNACSDRQHASALVTRLEDGEWAWLTQNDSRGALSLKPPQMGEAQALLEANRSGMTTDMTLFIKTYAPPPRLIVVGAVHIAQQLVPMAEMAGFEVILIDPRRGFATPTRFPETDLHTEWPDKALKNMMPDTMTAVVTLSHDPKIDDPALISALESDAFYIGALGSRRTHSTRIERLTEAGFGSHLYRIHAPVGLDLGGRSPPEIAISIIAEIIRVYHQKTP